MAWNLHFQCCFKSIGGVQYAVNVYEQDYTGGVVQLTGAAEPFVTHEDDSDDIFTPIRTQSGCLRVIDTDGTLLEQLIPTNNTERLVQLWSGTYTGTWPTGTFRGRFIRWQGFLQAQVYTQPWENNVNMQEIPVKSLLGALEDVQIGEINASAERNVAYLLWNAFEQFSLIADNDLTYLIVCSDASDALNTLLKPLLQWGVFFSEEYVRNQGDVYTEFVGVSYYDALSAVMSLYGLQMRENGSEIGLVQYDGSQNKVQRIGWGYLSYLANGSTVTASASVIASAAMMSALTWKGADNVVGYLQGARVAKVVLNLDGGISLHLNLPQTTEDASTVYEVEDIYSGQVFVQPHGPRTSNIETFTYSEYQQVGASGSNRVGSSTYAKCLANCVIMRPLYDPHLSSSDNLHTGAFPCRWYYKKETTDVPSLRNGLFLNQQYLGSGWSFTPYYCYSIQTSLAYKYSLGYLNINMMCYNFMRGVLAGDSDKLYFGEFTTIWTTKPQTKLYFILTWGTKEWNGTSWVTHSGNYNTFTIDFDGASVKTNKTADMAVDGSSGWFVPIAEEMSGTLRLYILNVGSCETDLGFRDAHSRIIADLSVEYLPTVDMVESQRDENVYRQQIMSAGFSDERSINLGIGTDNNNAQSMVFLKQNATTYIEAMTYNTGTGTKTQRPEMHLLDRMVAHYGQVRRTLTGIVQRGLGLLRTRYTYEGRNYFGVKKQTNWRDDTEEVKFIEVS